MTFVQYLPSMPLSEPVIAAMVETMEANLPGVITEANTNITDGFTVPAITQYLDYFPGAVELMAGLPIICVNEVDPGEDFAIDQQSFSFSTVFYAVSALTQSSDNQTLTKQLRRLQTCIAYAIQLDRLAAGGGIMRNTGSAWSVNILGARPGGAIDMEQLTGQPSSPKVWLSWITILLSSTHEQV